MYADEALALRSGARECVEAEGLVEAVRLGCFGPRTQTDLKEILIFVLICAERERERAKVEVNEGERKIER